MLIRNAAWSFGAQVVRLLTALLLIGLLDPAARGVQSLLVLVPTVLAALGTLSVTSAAPVLLRRSGSAVVPPRIDERRLLPNLLGLALCVLGLLLLVIVPLTPLLARYLSAEYPVSTADVLVGLLLLPPLLLGEYLRALLVARRDLRQVALAHTIQAVAQLLLAVLLVLGLHQGARGAVWATVYAAWLGFGWTIWTVRDLGALRPHLDWSVLRPLLGLGLRGHAGNMVQTFNYRLDAFLLQGFLGQAAVGLYQTGVLLAELVWYLPNAVGAALLPHVAATEDRQSTPRIVRHTLMLMLVGALLLLALAWPGFTLLRPAYQATLPPMTILLCGVVALGIHKVLASDLSGRGLPHYPSLTSAAALVVTIVGDLLLIPRFGMVGAAVASALAYMVQTVALLLVYRRIAQVGWRELLVLGRDDWRWYSRLLTRLGGAWG